MPKRFGYSFDDLPDGALGFPEVVFEDLTEWEEVKERIKANGSSDDACTEQRDKQDRV
jgi:hypothetical protein